MTSSSLMTGSGFTLLPSDSIFYVKVDNPTNAVSSIGRSFHTAFFELFF